jgi:hypothetical protein
LHVFTVFVRTCWAYRAWQGHFFVLLCCWMVL